MTLQEIFDTVSTHLFTQGHRSFGGEDNICLYRAPNGDMCAVGVLIKDYYVPEMDKDVDPMYAGTGVNSLIERFRDILPSWVEENADLLFDLQHIHDRWSSEEEMKFELKIVASRYNLDASVLNKF